MGLEAFFDKGNGNQSQTDLLFAENLELKKQLDELKESDRLLRLITEKMQDMIFIVDVTTVYRYASPSVKRITGVEPGEMIGKSVLYYIHPADALKIAQLTRDHLNSGLPIKTDVRIRCADGRYIWVEAIGEILRGEDGKISGAIICSREATDRKEAEEQRIRSLKEKEMLLKEVHHRVKNNLQIISSMLSLQSAYVMNKSDLHIFQDCQNRVKSMALVHEKLYKSESLSSINFGEYIRSLADTLYQSYGTRPDRVRFDLDTGDIQLDVDTSITCGLLVNEIISNSFKYAFPADRKGVVWLEMTTRGKEVTMVLGDDGIGMPESVDIASTGTLGVQLINSLVSQLDGSMQLERGHGTVYRIRFERKK